MKPTHPTSRLVFQLMLICSIILPGHYQLKADTLKPAGLTCEYLVNPLSVGTAKPRLAWKITSDDTAGHNLRQTAYRILVASSLNNLSDDNGDLWDSGKVNSSESAQIVYGGKPFDGTRDCFWKVCIWDDAGNCSRWSEPASWGNPPSEWNACWIGDAPDDALADYRRYVSEHHADADFSDSVWVNPPVSPSPLLRKNFTIAGKIKRAVLRAAALGYYRLWINGSRVGNQELAPEWTDYNDHVQYQTYDVTGLLGEGENVVAATLADGWALGRLAGVKWMKSFPHRGFYATDRRLIVRLDIELEDGRTLVVPTDSSWKLNPDGYIVAADNFAGETIDAGKIPSGWTEAGFDDSDWGPAFADSSACRHLVPQPNEPVKVHALLSPVKIWKRGNRYMVDFGQNIAGHCMLRAKGNKGDTIVLRHGEWLNDDGSLYTQSLGHARATDRFILSGGDDCFDPSMTYHGFQFVEIEGYPGELTPDRITAKAISSSAPTAGTFSCSNPDINRLYENIVWTQRNNMQSVLTDNPSRDERTGATGDIQIFAQSSIFNMDMAAFYTKFVSDMKDVASNGQFYSMIPSLRNKGLWDGWIGAPGWCEAGLIVPWRLYENYGDVRALETLYGEMCRHIDAVHAENPGLIWRNRHNHNGDWLNANTISPQIDPTYDTTRGSTPDDLFATAFFAYSTRLLADISGVLGRAEEQSKYNALADDIRRVFIDTFVSPDGRVEGDSQGAYSLALFYDLIPDSLRQLSFNHLLRCIDEYGGRLSTGFITTPMMMELLSEFGRNDVAYALLTSTRFPSWLYIVRNGATTVWERWDAWAPGKGFQNPGMNSLDHVAFGAVSEWMYRHILGINPDPEHPGYSRFTLSPVTGGGLTWAKGSYESIHGTIASSWAIEGDTTSYRFTIPPNTEAKVTLDAPPGAVIRSAAADAFSRTSPSAISALLGSGSYTVDIISKQ